MANLETITTEMVKELRDTTGISIMQCRRALLEAEGDIKKALLILKKTSSEIALKKGDREVKDGAVVIKKSPDSRKAVLVSLLCETDFVSKNEDFLALLQKLADEALARGVDGIDTMRTDAKEMINPVIQKTGENIKLGEAYLVAGENLGTYVHNNKIAVVVSLRGGDESLARDVAMHIAAMKPEYLSAEDIDAETQKTMSEVFAKEMAEVKKPAEIKQKILTGKLSAYFQEKTLLSQQFIKDPALSVGELLQNRKAELLEVKSYFI
ncbi:translation elongation factor Ts [Candidatus Nomurabacteria bacterium RIFCSPLOWO2_12_FULL_46_14]|uniref:Elongation factor Ts n=1 Tax=Candidatus Nomurabacteria bacterium RIFCSPLOWO2_12_FULL_46_14 TaxID=1801797 RepID=A0A1F6YAS8_9BACT|nr:MAG: translation elongation factor Ts [Candidatus Nomurabacteria bacterium RIFCSPLOWO2_12_FULL_46_14]